MKWICLVRHGKAEIPVPEKPDFDRVLSERGEHDMMKMSGVMKKLGINPSVIISSPALRAYQTARIIAKEFAYPIKKIRTRTSLYDQFDSAFQDIVETLDDSIESVLIVGHNPSISEYAWFLSKKFKKELPTSGWIIIESKAKLWAEIKEGEGKCICYDCPGLKGNSAHKKLLHRALQSTIAKQTTEILDYYDSSAPEILKDLIRKSSDTIAKAYIKKVQGKEKKKDT